MKVYLMYPEKNFDIEQKLPPLSEYLIEDLALEQIFKAMAKGDEILYEVAKKALLIGVNDIDNVFYRQEALKDCIKNTNAIQEIYDLSKQAIKKEKESLFGIFSKYPGSILYGAVQVLYMFVDILEQLKNTIDRNKSNFQSKAFNNFFEDFNSEITDDYLLQLKNILDELQFKQGLLIKANLTFANQLTDFTLCRIKTSKQSILKRVFKKPAGYSFSIDERDEGGLRALSEIKNKAINQVANILANTVYHMLDFFYAIRTELSFYIGCINLYDKLKSIGCNVSFPTPYVYESKMCTFEGLYDISLALVKGETIIDNDLYANNKNLFIITGANQGGKSTFLRSIAIAILMMQCGMFVGAKNFECSMKKHIFTHYRKEEDRTYNSGKFEEEIKRLDDIVSQLTPHSAIFFNETFSATNDKEGSKIAHEIISILIAKKITIFYVTHLYEFVSMFYKQNLSDVIFLRAQRNEDGTRTYKIIESPPLQTSFGPDLYYKIFETGGF